ncbi:hypothetical protein ACU686_37450 [Yinghuangia aomiensis]
MNTAPSCGTTSGTADTSSPATASSPPLSAGGVGTRTLTAASRIAAAWAWGRLRVGQPGLPAASPPSGSPPSSASNTSSAAPLRPRRRRRPPRLPRRPQPTPLWTASAALLTGLASPLAAAFLLMAALAWVPHERVWATRLAFTPAIAGLVAPSPSPAAATSATPCGGSAPSSASPPSASPSSRPDTAPHAASCGCTRSPAPSSTSSPAPSAATSPASAKSWPDRSPPSSCCPSADAASSPSSPYRCSPGSSPPRASPSPTTSGDSAADTRTYYTGMLGYLTAHNQPVGRVEIPFTRGHWETVYVAEHMPLARGWERQLDRARNEPLYDPDLTPERYHQWLRDTGVRYIALPDVPSTNHAYRESALLRAGQPWLEPVWADKHWRIWEVTDAVPLLDGPGQLTELTPSSFTFTADRPGDFTIRIHHTAWFTTDHPGTRITAAPDGWTRITVTTPGRVTVTAKASALLP